MGGGGWWQQRSLYSLSLGRMCLSDEQKRDSGICLLFSLYAFHRFVAKLSSAFQLRLGLL